MLDSPYVRRVGISLTVMGIGFKHEPLSVFRDFDRFATINPIVKAPTLVTDDGLTLVDSSLILDYLERLVPPENRLTPAGTDEYARSQRLIGLALAACEKTVQIVYERTLRPAEKQHQPWLDRIIRQLLAAYSCLNAEIGSGKHWICGPSLMQADITTAVAWRFTQSVVGEVAAARFPRVATLSQRAEALPEFRAMSFS
jgi:glutathione S-transferase